MSQPIQVNCRHSIYNTKGTHMQGARVHLLVMPFLWCSLIFCGVNLWGSSLIQLRDQNSRLLIRFPINFALGQVKQIVGMQAHAWDRWG
ncbi:hypothetical protein PRUPE_5G236000 [Prunus persica]|uniref:Uncharacterized protein n=1 Tax=Prunus persica TaxID=3760 RepID=A0A251PEF8_PRUPE|nr:hypothetical protein PRUPE_5G236000 [Prunus persica]